MGEPAPFRPGTGILYAAKGDTKVNVLANTALAPLKIRRAMCRPIGPICLVGERVEIPPTAFAIRVPITLQAISEADRFTPGIPPRTFQTIAMAPFWIWFGSLTTNDMTRTIWK